MAGGGSVEDRLPIRNGSCCDSTASQSVRDFLLHHCTHEGDTLGDIYRCHVDQQQSNWSLNGDLFFSSTFYEGFPSAREELALLNEADTVSQLEALRLQYNPYADSSRFLSVIEERLPSELFFRANRAQLVNLEQIATIESRLSNTLRDTLRNGAVVEFSCRASLVFRETRGI